MDETEFAKLAIEEDNVQKNQKMTMLQKLENAAPYNLFYNIILQSPKTWDDPNSIKFTDLLCPSLGQLKCSLQINFIVNINWLMEQYKSENLEKKPLTIVYGYQPFDLDEVKMLENHYPNVKHYFIEMKDDNWACHHSKIGIYVYEDGSLRVAISTANLFDKDWNIFNQQMWISPPCPRLASGKSKTSGESPTGFKSSLLSYLYYYDVYDLHMLEPWLDYVKNADFSNVKVFLVTSTPGNHAPQTPGSHLQQVGNLLKQYCYLPNKYALTWPIIAQASSLGHYGRTPYDWLCGNSGVLVKCLEGHKHVRQNSSLKPGLSVIFPTVDNVTNGYFGPEGATCLSYRKEASEQQPWLHTYLHQWKADTLDRTKAMPHQKTYCRISPNLKKLAWFLLTSANVTKSGWGSGIFRNGNVYVRNFEAGVLFFPQFFDEDYFEIDCVEKNKRVFPLMYDLPLTKYEEGDEAWCVGEDEMMGKK